MNNNYQNLIQKRNAFKRLSQISWSIKDAELRFPMGNAENEKQLLSIYDGLIPDVSSVLKELEDHK